MGTPEFNPVRDVLSGIIMAATSIPQLLAYAETVGYASYRGLTTAGFPLAVFGLVTGHPYLNAGVTSVSAIMTQSDLQGHEYVKQYGTEPYVLLVAAYAFHVGLASILLAMLGFGEWAKTGVPPSVQAGFQWGCAVGILVSALPNGFFLEATMLKRAVQHSAWLQRLQQQPIFARRFPGGIQVTTVLFALTHPGLWAWETVLLFVLGTAFVLKLSRHVLPSRAPPGTDVVLVTVLATLYSIHFDYQAAVVGSIPAAMDNAPVLELLNVRELLKVPLVERCFGGSWLSLVASALVFAAVSFLFAMGVLTGFESEDKIPWSARRELLAQGAGCLAAAAVGSAPISGSMSRSLVSRMTGATSPLACLVTALCWMLLQRYLSVMQPTPKAALSAVVVSAVVKGVIQPKDVLRLKGFEAVVAWLTGIIVCLTNPTQGFAVGMVIHVAARFLSAVRQRKAKTA